MPCHTIKMPGGVMVVACSRNSRRSQCSTPSCTNYSSKLCDYPVTRNGQPTTCDAKICDRCATSVGPDKDYCRPHAQLAAKGAK